MATEAQTKFLKSLLRQLDRKSKRDDVTEQVRSELKNPDFDQIVPDGQASEWIEHMLDLKGGK